MFNHIVGERWKVYKAIAKFLKEDQKRLQKSHPGTMFPITRHDFGKMVPEVIGNLQREFEKVATEMELAEKKQEPIGHIISGEVVKLRL